MEQASPPAAPAQTTPRILATDDRPEVLRVVRRALGERYECEFATSVADARKKLAEGPFDLALCDIQMPGESGFILIEEIARERPETAIVLVTGIDDPEMAERAFRLGALGYLVKPFWPGQLLITAANALRQHRFELAERHRHAMLLGSAQERAKELRSELIEAQRRAIEDLRATRQETVERLARAIEIHDAETGRHVNRMASIAAFLGAKLELDEDRVLLLRAAAPLHDVGKIGIADGILHKEGPLSPDERIEMERHTTIGHEILANSESDLLRMGAIIALTHHEHFDGGGYPRGLAGGDIPFEGRIVAVADVFDALLSNRSYRPAFTVEETTRMIESARGTQFDPEVAGVLLDNRAEVLELRG
jgi:putative two-component system response regulator